MKNKIKAALQQKYPQLGLADEVFEGVASAVETLITDEANIPAFVDGAEGMLKRYQSIADKTRGELAETKRELEALKAKAAEQVATQTQTATTQETTTATQTTETPDFAKLISDAVSAAVKPLQEEFASFKGDAAKKSVIKTAKDKFFANDYAKKYETERDDAWERGIEKFEDTGCKMTADELHDTVIGYFDKYVSRKGADIKKPFESEGSGEAKNFDTAKGIAAKLRKQE